MDYTPAVPTAAEMHGTIEEFIGAEGNIEQKVTLRVPWADRYTVALDTVGNARLWPQNNSGTVCAGARIKPVPSKYTKDGQVIVYEEALIELTYNYFQGRKLEATMPDGTKVLYSDSFEVIAESQPIAAAQLTWGNATGDKLIKEEFPPLTYSRFKFFRTIFGMPSIDPSALDLAFSSNDAPFTSQSIGLTFPIETLSFIPPTVGNSVSTTGSAGFTCRVGFDYRKDTWNKFWRTKTQQFEIIWGADNKQFKPYPPKSYAKWLF